MVRCVESNRGQHHGTNAEKEGERGPAPPDQNGVDAFGVEMNSVDDA